MFSVNWYVRLCQNNIISEPFCQPSRSDFFVICKIPSWKFLILLFSFVDIFPSLISLLLSSYIYRQQSFCFDSMCCSYRLLLITVFLNFWSHRLSHRNAARTPIVLLLMLIALINSSALDSPNVCYVFHFPSALDSPNVLYVFRFPSLAKFSLYNIFASIPLFYRIKIHKKADPRKVSSGVIHKPNILKF